MRDKRGSSTTRSFACTPDACVEVYKGATYTEERDEPYTETLARSVKMLACLEGFGNGLSNSFLKATRFVQSGSQQDGLPAQCLAAGCTACLQRCTTDVASQSML